MNTAFVPIKICGLTRESDVDAAVHAGVQALGFVLWSQSARAVSAARAAELARRLPAFVSPVLLFVNPTEAEVRQACAQVPGAWLQFHGDESPGFCAALAQDLGRRWIRAARIPQDPKAGFDLVKYAEDHSQADALLLDTLVSGYGGSGQTFNWSLLPPSVNCHLVLSGGLTPANVADGLRALRGRGRSLSVDVSSGVESAKGIKDPQKILAFIQAVRQACVL
jgi:phosphoribosylanthranilate isomerase